MNSVLVIGANGFIGRHVIANLRAHAVRIRLAVRDVRSAQCRFPGCDAVFIDMNRMNDPADWREVLDGCSSVINVAGILQSRGRQSARAIHQSAVEALVRCCETTGARRLVHVSAMGADVGVDTDYARTKQAAEALLNASSLGTVILRPSLVYASGSFGGTSTMRGLAGMPFVTPLIGDGGQLFQPIHADDLAEIARQSLDCELDETNSLTLEPAGPDIMSMADILMRMRRWLDFPPARIVRVPVRLSGSSRRLAISCRSAQSRRHRCVNSMSPASRNIPARICSELFRARWIGSF